MNNYEINGVTKTGRTFHALMSATLHDGVISSMMMDITDRNKMERVLSRREKSFLKAQEMAHLGYWEWDIRNNRITWSDEVYWIYGVDREMPLTNEILMQAIHPEDRQYHDKLTAEWLNNRGGEPFEYRIIRPDGDIRYMYAAGEVACGESGEPVKFMGIVQDVTESKLRERARLESDQRFPATFEQAAVGIAYVAPDGRFLRINQKFCDIVGYPQSEMARLSFQDITHPDELDADLEYVRHLLAGEIATYSMEKRYCQKDGELVWVNLTVSLLKDDAGQPKWFVFVVQDISARKQVEQAVLDYQRRLKDLAAELTRTEERERRNIATELHDNVGQSLAAMRMQLATARKETPGRKVGAILNDVSETLREAIQDTRNIITELTSPTLNELGLSAALTEWLREKVGDRYGLETRFSDDGEPKPLSEDSKMILFRSVRELLLNAVKHASAHQVSVTFQRKGATVRIVVEDDGIGLVDGKIPKQKIGEGGFGLFSIEERIKDIGGSLAIESLSGQGVKATLMAPLENE